MKYIETLQETPVKLRFLMKELVNKCTEQNEDVCCELGLNTAESNVLISFGTKDEMTSSELAKMLSISNSRITKIIDGLIEKELILREYGTEDRRVIHLRLTNKGKKTTKKLEKVFCKCYQDIMQKMNKGEIKVVLESLEKLVSVMNN